MIAILPITLAPASCQHGVSTPAAGTGQTTEGRTGLGDPDQRESTTAGTGNSKLNIFFYR